VDYFFLTVLLEEERLTLALEEREPCEERLTVDLDGLELRLGADRALTELLEGVREVDLCTELDEDGRRTTLLETLVLRLVGADRALTELLEGVREVDLRTELDEDGRVTTLLEMLVLRLGAE
jgi:hypothetical protein